MEKVIKKPYYKYKKDAYSKLNKFGKSLLSKVGFYASNPNSTHQDLRIGSQFQREAGSVSFYLGDLWLFTVQTSGDVIMSSNISAKGYQLGKLSTTYFMSMSKNVRELFRDGTGTVVKTLNDSVFEWSVDSERCVFRSFAGGRFINEG